ncbi:MAG: hypothetical protein ABI467_21675 [Kofleriaceae bacterium]
MRTLWIVVLCLCACKGHHQDKQSFHDGVQALCDLPDHVPDSGQPYDQRLAAVSAWATANITNPDVHKLGGLAATKDALAAAVQRAGLAHCKLLDNGMALQSFTEGMKVMCAGKPDDPAYFKGHLLNRDVIELFEAFAKVAPAERAAKLRAAVARANLGSCALLEKLVAAPAANAPAVTGLGLVELAPHAVSIVATESGVAVEGKPIAQIANGALAPAELATIGHFLTELAATTKGGTLTRVQLVVAPTLTAQVLNELVDTIDHAGYKDLALVVNADGVSRAIPFVRREVAAGKGVRPIVAIAGSTLRLYSGDGSEGTAAQPKATVASPAELAAALNELAARRWHGKRTDDDRWLYVTDDPTTPIQRVADVLAVMRATQDGGELFPRIALAP